MMARLEDLKVGVVVRGILSYEEPVTVIQLKWHGSTALDLTYRSESGNTGTQILYRDMEPDIAISESDIPWSFDGDPALFRLTSEAYRIRLAHLFDPLLAVHTSLVDPLPHQITAVYESMLPRQPLRFLLADDPGAGKTIMTGLLIKELITRGDLKRCMIVCPGNLVEQWQDELDQRFNLQFDIMTNDAFAAARTGNWFEENPLCICRLDKLSRNAAVQDKLNVTDWDIIVCDEAHKMSATIWSGGEVRKTKRYKLGEMLSKLTRHFLLLTATPHNGKDQDFQLFLALLDVDRFSGKTRNGEQAVDTSDVMRRMIKEELLKFDGRPLFPERNAYTVTYSLSVAEADLYEQVTEYVRNEFKRAVRMSTSDRRKVTVGFAMTVLQRRLASSPEAIYHSLRRRKERLEKRLQEEEHLLRDARRRMDPGSDIPDMTEDEIDELDDAPDGEVEELEERLVDQASAAQTIEDLRIEIDILKRLENIAQGVCQSQTDRKWEELSSLLQNRSEMFDPEGRRRKLILFTEHRDTLNYLRKRIIALIAKPETVVMIHGGMRREERKDSEQRFIHDKDTEVLLATDAAGEGINLQCAHLIINYDLPWNPNRLEQRFGRIHRIGQTEVCHCWNLVAADTREGEVFRRLLGKLEEERKALGGKVFDILGKLTFDNKPLRQLLMEAVREGDRPEVRARLNEVVDQALERNKIKALLEDQALVHDMMEPASIQKIREDMERSEARRLQPHFVAEFFLEAFKRLGGELRSKNPNHYEVTSVPAIIRNRNRDHLRSRRVPVQRKYADICFDKNHMDTRSRAALICPGHPLLDSTLDLILEKHRSILKKGAILIDDRDEGNEVRVLVYLEHALQDARTDNDGKRREVSRKPYFIELTRDGTPRDVGYAPYLDYRPPTASEIEQIAQLRLTDGIGDQMIPRAEEYATVELAQAHLKEVKERTTIRVDKTMAAVKTRLSFEINFYTHRAQEHEAQERAGHPTARTNAQRARQRAEELTVRLKNRMDELERERKISPCLPHVTSGALIVPIGLLHTTDGSQETPPPHARETRLVEMVAMDAVMKEERRLGFDPYDVSAAKCGYDIESRIPPNDSRFPSSAPRLRFIEVKGRVQGATTVTVTKNEILTALNKPDQFILAIVEVEGGPQSSDGGAGNDIQARRVTYIRQPFEREPDFAASSVDYKLQELLAKGELSR